MRGARASSLPSLSRMIRSSPGTVAETMPSICIATSCPSASMRGRTLSRIPTGRYLKSNEILSPPRRPEAEVATGISSPTRIDAWRLSSVSTEGRESTSASPLSTRARRRRLNSPKIFDASMSSVDSSVLMLGMRPRVSVSKFENASSPEGVSRSHSTPRSLSPVSLTSRTMASMRICRAGTSSTRRMRSSTSENCSGRAGW